LLWDAEVSEEWTTPVDTRMEAMGGVVSHTWREYFEEEMNAREVASLKAEIEQLKAEEAACDLKRSGIRLLLRLLGCQVKNM
jgi:hypothetical protein